MRLIKADSDTKYIKQKHTKTIESELLICCSHNQLDSKKLKTIEHLICEDIDWNQFVQLGVRHGIVPLIYQNLKLTESEKIPNDTLKILQEYSHSISLKNILYLKELLDILRLFNTNGVKSISFKGPILAYSIYGSLGLRHFCDLDMLVHKLDFLKAFNLLLDRGYKPSYELDLLNKNIEIFHRASRGEYSLSNGQFTIDLHQVLTVERFMTSDFTFEYLWSRREIVSVSGHILESFQPEDLIMYLCIHGSKDCWRSLKWICDVAEFINCYPELNWHSLTKQAKSFGCERMLLLGLFLAYELMEINLPDFIHQNIQEDSKIQKLATNLIPRLFLDKNTLGRKFTLEKFRLHLEMIERKKDKLGCILDLYRFVEGPLFKMIPNNEDHRFFPLPSRLYFLYYFIKPVRLFVKYFISK